MAGACSTSVVFTESFSRDLFVSESIPRVSPEDEGVGCADAPAVFLVLCSWSSLSDTFVVSFDGISMSMTHESGVLGLEPEASAVLGTIKRKIMFYSYSTATQLH